MGPALCEFPLFTAFLLYVHLFRLKAHIGAKSFNSRLCVRLRGKSRKARPERRRAGARVRQSGARASWLGADKRKTPVQAAQEGDRQGTTGRGRCGQEVMA
ncbi:hypothetical protein B0J13DRAFT_530884 [Dactylonectria estremocensis]|uniref:Uncharacterized protein n=1 Tax=Dactylonectria estremocensis TaxID=1079267 RepID=A0A9P9DTH8_9HYPO|nr:hypothetical protein B0J13DRAFT_530884 [Dactylonectria estremocensis]